jgi:hypothetical protein
MHYAHTRSAGHLDQSVIELFARDTTWLVRMDGWPMHSDGFVLSPVHEESHGVDRLCTTENLLQPELMQKSDC